MRPATKGLLFALICVAAGAIFVFTYKPPVERSFTKISIGDVIDVNAPVNILRRELNQMRTDFAKANIDPATFERVDFSLPGDPSYGDNPAMEVFNPSGPIRLQPPTQPHLDAVTGIKGTRLVFNLRRTIPAEGSYKGKILDTLYAVITPLSEPYCAVFGIEIRVHNGVEIYTPIEIAANNHTIMTDSASIPVNDCIKVSQHKNVVLFPIAQRVKASENDIWQTK